MQLMFHSRQCDGPVRLQRGLSLIEFAVLAGLLVILLVAATDYSLAILARQEIHGAARAGAEFAINQGYNVNGIQAAARNPRGTGSPGLKFASIVSVTPDATTAGVTCACYADFSANGISRPPNWNVSPPACSVGTADGLCPAPATTDIKILPSAYVTVTVSGTYTPLFPAYWVNLQAGKLPLNATYVARTFFRTW